MRATILLFCLGTLLVATTADRASAQRSFDLLIRGGDVIDGSGAPGQRADVGIADGRIAVIGALDAATASATIDARGLVVAPGFIDVHTHADEIAAHPLAEHFVRMGVTTLVAGNCGGSAEDVGAALAAIERTGIAVNYATLFGHNTVRRAVMGTERRAPTADELAKMQTLVGRAMADGAVGFSTGLQYVPGTYAEQSEIVALATVSARSRRGVRHTHAQRGHGDRERR